MLPRFILLYDLISCLLSNVYALNQSVNQTDVLSQKHDTRSPAQIQSDITDFLDQKMSTGGYDRNALLNIRISFYYSNFSPCHLLQSDAITCKSIKRRIIPPSEGPLPIIVDILIESIDAISEIKMDFRKMSSLEYFLNSFFQMQFERWRKHLKVWHYLFVTRGLIRLVFN